MSHNAKFAEAPNGVVVRRADLSDSAEAALILQLLNEYAQHSMGQSAPLDAEIQNVLISRMQSHPNSLAFLAEIQDQAIGIATCFVGFSTFKANKLINIHDLFVRESARGKGVGGQIIDAVAAFAKNQGFCAVTLEVLGSNPARFLYAKKGFKGIGNLHSGDTQSIQADSSEQEPVTFFGKLPISSE